MMTEILTMTGFSLSRYGWNGNYFFYGHAHDDPRDSDVTLNYLFEKKEEVEKMLDLLNQFIEHKRSKTHEV